MERFILMGILLVAAFFRLYNLSHAPPSLSLDEVSIGYNAYSILHTGRDEYGTLFPMLLRAYDDFRPALYVYLTIPFVWALGLSAFAIRLPSVLLSLLTVVTAYGIGTLVGKKYFSFDRLGEITAMLLALSPWHIYISRLGHEANLGLTLFVFGIYFFLRAVLSGYKPAWIWSAVAFGLSVHGYQSEKIVAPVLILIGVFLFWKDICKAKYYAILAGLLCFIIALPAIVVTLSPVGLMRFRGTSAFTSDDPEVVYATNQYVNALAKNDRIGQIINSRYVIYARIFIHNYSSHFSLPWLFTGGAKEAHKVPGLGLLYMWEAPFLLLGLWALFKSKTPRGLRMFLAAWMLISPLPAAITTQAPHAMRSYTFLPVLQLIEALGLCLVLKGLTEKQTRMVAFLLALFVLAGVSMLYRGYFVRFPVEQSNSFQYAMEDAVKYALAKTSDYKAVQFSNRGNLYQSYMFFLFYSKFDPSAYLSYGGTDSGGYEEVHTIGKYKFGILPQSSAQLEESTLYFYDAKDVPSEFRTLKTYTNLDGKSAIVAGTRL